MSLSHLTQSRCLTDNKFKFYIETLEELKPLSNDLVPKINGLQNLVLHAAPEIIDKTFWLNTYNLCFNNLSDNSKYMEIFQDKVGEFKQIFPGILK
ncbi:hypothetical protein CPAV1605_178 [seawater metagenome]|uniref:Uncharacterized protein n=1 Tax=seawater metagenome TaxID=1561972 RepID=A0A5E8CHD9_9ZZZZ